MIISTVIGARPQFVKASIMSRLIADRHAPTIRERIIHTGQHYDDAMSDVFFRELEIPPVAVNLGVGSSSHGRMTGRMLELIEKDLLEHPPDMLLVYGDTNSTLAGALAASKLTIPVAHVEAGLRSHWKKMPEEQNRILTDHLSELLFIPTETARENLRVEGIENGVHLVGDIMLDVAKRFTKLACGRPDHMRIVRKLRLPERSILMTLHRAENTDDPRRLQEIVTAINAVGERPVVFPIHPRTRKALATQGLSFGNHVRVIEPVGYLDMVELEQGADLIITDSGGVQKEAYFFRKPCITLRDQTEWLETVTSGWNRLVHADREIIRRAVLETSVPQEHPDFYGDGNAGSRMLEIIEAHLRSRTAHSSGERQEG